MANANRIEVLCGLSGSGKTSHALRRYAEQVREHGEDTALLILPTARVVRQARETLVGQGDLPGLLDPRIFTFPQLAQLILNANHECATAIGASAQTLLLRGAVHSLASAGELADLAEVSRLPGFAKALGELITDLKRAAVRPAQFCKAMQEAGLSRPAHREIGGLYCAYQWLLICLRSFDEEGLFWLARDVLWDDRRRPLERVGLMIVDGFTDFTTTQLDMLQVLAAGIPGTVITLDHSPEDAREGLAPWFRDTLTRLADHLGGVGVSFLSPDRAADPLAHLRANLFTAGVAPRVDADGRVHLLTCPSRSREVREVLARVKGLLATGQARPADIAIVARDLTDRAREIEFVAARMGVPVCVEARRSPVDSPAVRAVLHAYETVVEGYRREDVLALLRSTCFTFEALTSRGLTAEDVAVAAEQALIIEGREQWLRRLRLHAGWQARRHDESDQETPPLAAIAEALDAVFGLLPDPRRKLTVAERVAELREFIARTDLWRNVARSDLADHASANLRALERLEAALDELEHARVGETDAPSLAAFHRLLRDVLDDLADSPPPPAGERVSVLDARQARQLRFPVTFVIGLCEGDFPRKPREEPFFSATELARLEAAGVVLERRRSPEAHEPLLFYGAVASAQRDLWLTRPSADVDGGPLQPSHYLREVRRLFAEGTLDEREVLLSQMVAERGQAADPRELADLAFFDLTADADRESPIAYNALVRQPQGQRLIPRVLDALRIEDLRDSLRASGPYVGEIEQARLTEDLGTRFGAERHFTASELTAYAVCPFDHFCRFVLKLNQPEYATAALDPQTIGIVRHSILATFARRRMDARSGQPLVAPGDEEQALAELEEIARERFRTQVERGQVPDEALWTVEEERCRRDLALWVGEEAGQFGEAWPIRAELDFGWQEDAPTCLPHRDDILLGGRIDRVNLAPDGAGFVLIDYKSGQLPSPGDVKSGLDLQFPIYTIGAIAELPELARAPCAGWLYCRVTRPLDSKGLRKVEAIDEVRAVVEPLIAAHVDAIRAGRFSYVGIARCAERCASAEVCRHVVHRRADGGEDADEDS